MLLRIPEKLVDHNVLYWKGCSKGRPSNWQLYDIDLFDVLLLDVWQKHNEQFYCKDDLKGMSYLYEHSMGFIRPAQLRNSLILNIGNVDVM
jgi:hypothetical protein